jgi:AsmA protein
MKAFGKILGLSFLGLLLIIVGLGFALTHLFDPNDYKDEIRQLARDKANLELTLNGDIGWSLFPWLGLQLHDTTLASAKSPEQPFAELAMLGLSVRVLPLLRKEVQMSDIRVEGLNLRLLRDKNGHGNWEDIGKPAQPIEQPTVADGESAPPAKTPAEQGDNKRAPVQLDIDSLTVRNARVEYHDARSGQQLTAEGIELSTGAIREGSEIPLKLSAFFGTSKPLMRVSSNLEASLRFDRALQRYQLENLHLAGEASGEPLQGKTLAYSVQGQLLLDQVAQVAEWNNLKLSANQLRALGEIKVRDLDEAAKLSGALSIASFDLRAFLDGIGMPLPAMADAKALNRVELVSRLTGSQTSLAFEELELNVDDSKFNGRIAIEDFNRQALRVQLQGGSLDLDRYLAPKSKDSAKAARQAEVKDTVAVAAGSGSTPLPDAPTSQAWSEAALLPLDSLRKLDLQLALVLQSLKARELSFDKVDLKGSAKNGVLTLEQLRAGLQGGSLALDGRLDARQQVPQLTLNPLLGKIPVQTFTTDDAGKTPVKGLLQLESRLTSAGNSEKALIDNLNGDALFSLTDGVLVDANLEQQLCQAIATLNRKSLSKEPRGKDTPFQELKGTLQIRNGVASNPDLKASIPGLTVNGNGDLDLRVLGMDYRIGIIIEGDRRQMPDEACTVNERYVGLEWPLRCRGPVELGAKACRVDKDGMGKVAAKLAGNKLNEKIEEKLGDKVSPELKDALRGLFNR